MRKYHKTNLPTVPTVQITDCEWRGLAGPCPAKAWHAWYTDRNHDDINFVSFLLHAEEETKCYFDMTRRRKQK